MKLCINSLALVFLLSLTPTLSWAKYASVQLANLTGASVGEVKLTQTAIIHTGADDYTTAPAGNAGPPMACGVIRGPFDKSEASGPRVEAPLE